LADLKARRGSAADAEALYQNAEDVIDAMLVNLHEAYWSSSLAGAMSDTYLQHFRTGGAGGQGRARTQRIGARQKDEPPRRF